MFGFPRKKEVLEKEPRYTIVTDGESYSVKDTYYGLCGEHEVGVYRFSEFAAAGEALSTDRFWYSLEKAQKIFNRLNAKKID